MHDHQMIAEHAVHWGGWEAGAAGCAVAGFALFLFRRSAVGALVAAMGSVLLAASPWVRAMAATSHLVSMAALELLLVAAPLLIVWTVPRWTPRSTTIGWAVFAIAAAVSYAGLLVVVHMPRLHEHAGMSPVVPLWVPPIVLLVGIGYWLGIMRPDARVSVRARRAALIGGQEVAAFIGLLSMFGAWPLMAPHGAAGLSAAWDQRIGGLLMLLTCAVVAIPILRDMDTGRVGGAELEH